MIYDNMYLIYIRNKLNLMDFFFFKSLVNYFLRIIYLFFTFTHKVQITVV